MAATPSYQGQTTAAFNADTFRMLKSTKHPDEAWTVLTYLLDEPRELLKTYGAMPAGRVRSRSLPPEATAGRTTPQTIDWNVVKEGVNYADVPNFERYMPAYNETLTCSTSSGRSGRRRRASTSTRRSPT